MFPAGYHGPGRPKGSGNKTKAKIAAIFERTLSTYKIAKQIKVLIETAENDETKLSAMRLWLEYIHGKPPQQIQQQVDQKIIIESVKWAD